MNLRAPIAETLQEYNDRMNRQAFEAWQKRSPPMPNIRVMLQSKYLNKEDVPVTIRAVVQDASRSNGGGPPDIKWLVYFAEINKALKLNATTIKTLAASFGDESDHWIGKRVRLYVDPTVMMAGQIVGGVRVQCPRASAPSAAPPRESTAAATGAAPAAARFDPMTGKPLNAQLPSAAQFDPVTGEIGAGVDPEFDDDIPF